MPADATSLKVIREADDPIALRASIGGREGMGFYLVYRGEPQDVLAMLRQVVEQAEAVLERGPRG
jgi:hypothetical protein